MALIPKKYIHDKQVIMLLSINIFLAFMSSLVILVRLGAGQSNGGYFVQYRSDLGISAFTTGNAFDVVGFLFFAFIVLVVASLMSFKAYLIRRELAIIILLIATLLLILNAVVSNGLLRLH